MKLPLILAAALLCASGAAQAQGFKRETGPQGFGSPGAGGFGTAKPATPTPGYKPYEPPAPKAYGIPKTSTPDGGEFFKPFQPTSTYSNRGGVDAYRKTPKPKPGYSVYGND